MAKVKTIEIIDIEAVRNEKLRYQTNKLAYYLGLFACVVSIFAGFVGLNTMKASGITVVKILLNIVILLFGFAFSESAKKYSFKASVFMFVLAGINVFRIFWCPIKMIKKWNAYKKSGDENILASNFSKLMYNSTDQLRGYLPRNGVFRGLLMMILLITSSVLFALSGYFGLVKTLKLRRYLKSINVEF